MCSPRGWGNIMTLVITSGKIVMKWDVGMSHHEKEREQEDAYTKTDSHS